MKARIEKSKSGKWTLVYEDEGRRHPIYSLYDPRKDGIRFYREFGSQESEFYIFLGIGLGYHITPFVESRRVRKVIILEPDDELYAVVENYREVRDLLVDKKVELYTGRDTEQFILNIKNHYEYLFFNGIQVLSYKTLKALFRSQYSILEEKIQTQLTLLVNDGLTIGKFARVWMNNFMNNVKKRKGFLPVTSLYGRWSGTAVIAGAGPSLDRVIGDIEKQRENFYLIAADASVKPLVRRGIRPDLIVSIDPQASVFYHFAGLKKDAVQDIPAVLSYLSCPAVFDLFRTKYLYFTLHPTSSLFHEVCLSPEEIVLNYRAVSSLAFKLAVLMGFETIHLAGLDFSYPGMRMYAQGTFFYDYYLSRATRFASSSGYEIRMIRRSTSMPQGRGSGSFGIKESCYGKPAKFLPIAGANLTEYKKELEGIIADAGTKLNVKVMNWSSLGMEIEGAQPVSNPSFTENFRARGVPGKRTISVPALQLSEELRRHLAMTIALRYKIYKNAATAQDAAEYAHNYLCKKYP